jgi:hypothetical protein
MGQACCHPTPSGLSIGHRASVDPHDWRATRLRGPLFSPNAVDPPDAAVAAVCDAWPQLGSDPRVKAWAVVESWGVATVGLSQSPERKPDHVLQWSAPAERDVRHADPGQDEHVPQV